MLVESMGIEPKPTRATTVRSASKLPLVSNMPTRTIDYG